MTNRIEAFKYTDPRYLEKCREGLIHLSSFNSIRQLETVGIGDALEGGATKSGSVDLDTTSEDEHTQRILADHRRFGVNISGGQVSFNNVTMSRLLPDAFMFCVSMKPNHAYWESEFGYVPALHIFDFQKFASKVANGIKRSGIKCCAVKCQVEKCTYEHPVSIADPTLLEPSYFRKTLTENVNYSLQHEARAVFRLLNLSEEFPKSLDVKVNFDDGNVWVF